MQLRSLLPALVAVCAMSRADAAPSITAVVNPSSSTSNSPHIIAGNFALTGTGFTAGNGLVHVWLVDYTTNTLLWFSPAIYAFPGGLVGVNGPMRFVQSPPFVDKWLPEVTIPCGRNVRMVAKDGRWEDPLAQWSNLSDNLSQPCPPPPN